MCVLGATQSTLGLTLEDNCCYSLFQKYQLQQKHEQPRGTAIRLVVTVSVQSAVLFTEQETANGKLARPLPS
jgi:hypothetical protein